MYLSTLESIGDGHLIYLQIFAIIANTVVPMSMGFSGRYTKLRWLGHREDILSPTLNNIKLFSRML